MQISIVFPKNTTLNCHGFKALICTPTIIDNFLLKMCHTAVCLKYASATNQDKQQSLLFFVFFVCLFFLVQLISSKVNTHQFSMFLILLMIVLLLNFDILTFYKVELKTFSNGKKRAYFP